jgi:hypothetical protein
MSSDICVWSIVGVMAVETEKLGEKFGVRLNMGLCY